MARARIVVVGLMVFCLLAAGAMAGSSKGSSKKGDDDAADDEAVDDDAVTFSKKDYKECYKNNPACVGVCEDVDDDGELECVAPADADDQFDLCAGDKHTKGSWAEWTDGDAACTCAEGFVTSAKVREAYLDTDKMPKASKMCTVECSGNVECGGTNGPLDCFCLNGDDDEGAAEYISKKDQTDAEKEINEAAKDDYKTAVDDAKDAYETAKADAKDAYETAKDDAKAAKSDNKDDDYKSAVETAKDDYKTAVDEAKQIYEEAKADAKAIYEDAKADKHNKGGDDDGTVDDDGIPDDDVKKAAAPKAPVAAPAKPAAAAAPAKPAAAAAAPAKPVVAPATPAPKA